MKVLNKYIEYIPSSNDPLSAEVYVINGEEYCYIYDVGNNESSLNEIKSINKKKKIVLSHYHKDHTGNIDNFDYEDLFVGDLTYDTIKKGTIVESNLCINDGIEIEIHPCVSPHVDGSLIMTVNNEYTFIADLYFTRSPFVKEKAYAMIEELKKINTKYFVVSHQTDTSIIPKEELIEGLIEYFK